MEYEGVEIYSYKLDGEGSDCFLDWLLHSQPVASDGCAVGLHR